MAEILTFDSSWLSEYRYAHEDLGLRVNPSKSGITYHHNQKAGNDVYVSDAVERGRAYWARYPEIFKTEPFFRTKKEGFVHV
jgi:hypothetical protein